MTWLLNSEVLAHIGNWHLIESRDLNRGLCVVRLQSLLSACVENTKHLWIRFLKQLHI